MNTLLIKNGMVIDGTGSARFPGHVLVEDDRIAAVLPPGQALPEAASTIDASGCIVCPGFIDMHSHSDWALCLEDNPLLLSCLVEQGITTIVGGNCGFSPAPFRPGTLHLISQLKPLLVRVPDFTWTTMDGLLDRMNEIGPAVNIAELVGHAALRLAGADTLRGRMTASETDRCLGLLADSLDQGACGLSFGLGYEPGMYSPLDEIEAFCRTAKAKGKPVTVHLKALSAVSPTYPIATFEPHNIKSVREMLDVARKTGIRLQISHLIFVGRNSFWTAEKILRMIEEARRDGVDVMFDAFPYTCGNTTINVVIPHWFLKNIPAAYRSTWMKLRLRAELEVGFRLVGFRYEDFQVMEAAIPGHDHLNGMRISDIGRMWGMSPFDALLRISELSGGGTLTLFHAYSGEPGREQVLEEVLSHDLCLFETDAVIKDKCYPNPAAMGTFPLLLGPFTRDRKLFTLEQAIRKSTSESASRFGIRDRGEIARGSMADMVVFDPETLSDTPPVGMQPAGRPTGIRHVLINGTTVVRDGASVPAPPQGRVLRV